MGQIKIVFRTRRRPRACSRNRKTAVVKSEEKGMKDEDEDDNKWL